MTKKCAQGVRMQLRLAWCLALVGCVAEPAIEPETSAVVGGAAESGHPHVGYLMIGDLGPYCGATLIAPSVAVTAAHCVHREPAGTRFGIGFGAVYSSPGQRARQVLVHPAYDPSSAPRYRHDVALLILETPATVVPGTVAGAQTNDLLTYVGYGRTTTGDYHRSDGYSGERKSAAQKVYAKDTLNLFTQGSGGGLCWGDSGGPLLRPGTTEVLGVLADFAGTFYCQSGNAMVFTALDGERPFIDEVVACSASSAPCVPTVPSCTFACASYGYQAGECWQGWRCDSGCLSYQGWC
jgi:secreted trypsin-like serine protease